MVIRRGVQRLLSEMGAHVLPELSLATGRRADLVALTRQGDIWIVEIKVVDRGFPGRPQMAGLPAAFRPLLLRDASGRSGRHLPAGLRLHPLRRLRRRNPARGSRTPHGGGDAQGDDAALRTGRRGTPAGRRNRRRLDPGARRRKRVNRNFAVTRSAVRRQSRGVSEAARFPPPPRLPPDGCHGRIASSAKTADSS